MRQVEIAGLAVEALTGAPLVVLRETAEPHRVLAIAVGGLEAAAIGVALAGETPLRPLTYDLMASLVERLGAKVERVEVTELRDGAFLAELAVNGPGGGHRLDTRPSDAIALAVRTHAPLYVRDAVLDEAGVVLADESSIDEQVAAFRAQLDQVDAADFSDGSGPADPSA